MPTVEEWDAALVTTRYVSVDSTQTLASKVNQKSNSATFTGASKLATSLPEFSPPRQIAITTSELLLILGRIMSPRIENLVDLYSTWAKIRYVWAFNPDPNPSELRLSDEALNIDFHQKGLMSDEIGTGMAALISERFFGGSNPIDVDVAFRSQTIQGLTYQYSTSPDYIFERAGGGYLVVECKGTRSGKGSSYKQLKRGTEQLPSLVFPSGVQPLALVIGTSMSDSGTDVFVIDPPDKRDSKEDQRIYSVENETEFKANLDLMLISNLYLFSGATGLAAEVIPDRKIKEGLQRLIQRDHPPEQIRISEMQEEYLGVSRELRLIGDVNSVSIFQGLSANVYHALSQQNIALITEESKRHYRKAVSLSQQGQMDDLGQDLPGPILTQRANNSFSANVFGKDGTFLRIEVRRD